MYNKLHIKHRSTALHHRISLGHHSYSIVMVFFVFLLNFSYAESFTDTLVNEIGVGVIHGLITRPAIVEKKLRYENISDIEVRQIQAVLNRIHPGAIVNIGGVTEGCHCDEEEGCTNQVPIVSYLPSGSIGITLSKIDNEWMIGAVQGWWLEYQEVFRFGKKAHDGSTIPILKDSFESKVQELHDSMPTCTGVASLHIPK